MGDRDHEETRECVISTCSPHRPAASPVGIIHDPGQRIVPRQKRRQQPKEATRFDDGRVRRVRGGAVQVAEAEQQEGEIERQEEEKEGERGPQGGEEEQGREDEPALGRSGSAPASRPHGRAYHQEEAKRVVKRRRAARRFDRGRDIESPRRQGDGKGQPEPAVRGQRRGRKRVSRRHFPGDRSATRVTPAPPPRPRPTTGFVPVRLTTCPTAAAPTPRSQTPAPRRCWGRPHASSAC